MKKRKIVSEVVIIALFGLMTFLAFSRLEATSRLIEFFHRWKLFHFDDLAVSLFVIIFGLAWFSYRRWRESNSDLYELKAASEQLGEMSERCHLVMENITDLIFTMDMNLQYTYMSPSVEHVLGYPAEEYVTKPLTEVLTPASVTMAMEVFYHQMELEASGTADPDRSQTFEFENICKDGSRKWTECTLTFTRDENGVAVGMLGVSRDIHDRKKAEMELRQSEKDFRRLFEYAPDAYYMIDFNGIFLDGNHVAEKLIGYKKEELIGKSFLNLNLLTPEEIERAANHMIYDDNREPIGPDEFSLIRKDGSLVPVEIRTFHFTFDNQPVILGIARDITDRKKTEEEKEQRMAKETAELRAQLLQSQKMEAIGRLAGGIAHDFNNILTGIIGYSEVVLANMKPESQHHDDLKEIRKAADRAACLTQQLLAFSRKQIISPKVIHLNEQIDHSQKMLSRMIGEDIEVVFDTSVELLNIKADPGQIDQVLINLVVNARDAMPDGGRLVIQTVNVTHDTEYCELNPEARPGDFVRLSVSDTGVGMDEETLTHIFEPFYSTKDVGKGTGLGLAMVYGIVKQNDGFINVYSEPGKGSAFHIYFPAVHEKKLEVVPSSFIPWSDTDQRILLVEDEQLVRDLTVKILRKIGYRVIEAKNGREALELCRKNHGKIDLLLTDVVMPEMNGKELVNQILECQPHMKVLYMSGYTEDVIAYHGILDECTHFVQKPFTIDSLANKLRNVLDEELAS